MIGSMPVSDIIRIVELLGYKQSNKTPTCWWRYHNGNVVFIHIEGSSCVDTMTTLVLDKDLETGCECGSLATIGIKEEPGKLGLTDYDIELYDYYVDEFHKARFDYFGKVCDICRKPVPKKDLVVDHVRYLHQSCFLKQQIKQGFACRICGRKLTYGRGKSASIMHHVSYANNKIIDICKSCHARLHFHPDKMVSSKLYYPQDKRPQSNHKNHVKGVSNEQ